MIDKLTEEFMKEFESMSADAQKAFIGLLKANAGTLENINLLFEGFQEMSEDFVVKYSELVKDNKNFAKQLGYKFSLTNEGVVLYSRIQDITVSEMMTTKQTIANSLARSAVSYQIEGQSIPQVRKEITKIFDGMGRRLNTEAFNGAQLANETLRYDFFQKVGVKKYIYDGPKDDDTRDECRATLNDSRQETGWTMDEINNSQTPFITRGGWNCRHEWIPYIET